MDIDFAFRARVTAIVRQALQPTAGCTQPEIFLSHRQYINWMSHRAEGAAMNRLSFRLLRFSRSAASLLALCALSGLCAHADEKSPYDGVWQTTLSCVNASGALGYSFKFPSSVKDGVLHGQKGTAHEAGWLSIDGSIAADGTADLYVDGLVGASAMAVGQRPAGTKYGYHVAARFSGDRAEGHRVEGRPCTVVFEREK